ncbi:MAG: hypothetical protein ACREJO_00160 [Phycisphaerales bacterium]
MSDFLLKVWDEIVKQSPGVVATEVLAGAVLILGYFRKAIWKLLSSRHPKPQHLSEEAKWVVGLAYAAPNKIAQLLPVMEVGDAVIAGVTPLFRKGDRETTLRFNSGFLEACKHGHFRSVGNYVYDLTAEGLTLGKQLPDIYRLPPSTLTPQPIAPISHPWEVTTEMKYVVKLASVSPSKDATIIRPFGADGECVSVGGVTLRDRRYRDALGSLLRAGHFKPYRSDIYELTTEGLSFAETLSDDFSRPPSGV